MLMLCMLSTIYVCACVCACKDTVMLNKIWKEMERAVGLSTQCNLDRAYLYVCIFRQRKKHRIPCIGNFLKWTTLYMCVRYARGWFNIPATNKRPQQIYIHTYIFVYLDDPSDREALLCSWNYLGKQIRLFPDVRSVAHIHIYAYIVFLIFWLRRWASHMNNINIVCYLIWANIARYVSGK